MSDSSQAPGWWLASDGRWYAPDLWRTPPPATAPLPAPPATGPAPPQSFQPQSFQPQSYGAPGAYGGPGYEPTAYAVPTRRPVTNRFAVASLICSCAGILLIGIPSVFSNVFGFVARAQIRQSNEAQGGQGLAVAGFVVGFVVVVLLAIGLVVNAADRGLSVVVG